MTRLTACPDAETVARRAAAHIARQLAHAREQRGVAHLALSGGTTPGRTYELLGAEPAALAGVELWFADERCVGPEDPESNYRLVAETLLAAGALPHERVHRMQGELGPHEGAARYAAELAARVLAEPPGAGGRSASVPVLDLVVLGIGPDGHVASLFPGAATLEADRSAVCLGVEDSPKPPPQRITLSLAVLLAARECVLLATGASKADALAAMLGQPSPHVPASLLRRERLTVLADDAAAPAAPPR
ncbi:MAG TPA: 6-phosphogluconolactonase [Solirubrobacteraceae bacterium]|jgi:6-phosphogluconolactonase|nr:6-phosphogluconolactonase [Solirubrobacteraceae bacterium]